MGIVSVTKDMRMFDLYDEIVSLVKNASQDAFDKIDQSLADVFLYGTSTSYTDVYGDTVTSTCPDSACVFSATHSNGTTSAQYSNLITLKATSTANPALSRQAIVDARQAAMTYTDPEGMMRPINLDTLLVAPANQDLAERIVYSPGVQGTPNVDTNPLKGSVKIKVWPRLERDSAGTDKSARWFMYDSKKVGNSLKALFAEKPSMDAPEQVYKNKNWEYSIDFYYAIGRGFPAYVFGSTGAS